MRKIITTVLVLLLLCQFVGCGEAANVDEELQGEWEGTIYRTYPVAIRFDDSNFSYAIADSIWVSKGRGTYEILDDVIVLTFSETNLGDGDLTGFTFLQDKTVELEYQFEDGKLSLWHEEKKLTWQAP